MTGEHFLEKLREIYGTFGKNMAPNHVQDAIFRRVRDLPDAFMDFALRKLENEVSLPANLGRHLRLELWPDYLDENPQLRAATVPAGCPRCASGNPGIRNYWEADGTPHTCRCICNTDPRTAGQWTPTDAELLSLGFYLRNPLPTAKYLPPHLRKVIGHVEPAREAHRQYLEQEEVWF